MNLRVGDQATAHREEDRWAKTRKKRVSHVVMCEQGV